MTRAAFDGIGLNYATSNERRLPRPGIYDIAGNSWPAGKTGSAVNYRKTGLGKRVSGFDRCSDSAGMCLFSTFALGGGSYCCTDIGASGIEFTPDDVVAAGERIYNMERMYNLSVGFTAADDTLPERMFNDPVKAGPMKGNVSRVPEMLPHYYEARGWDENGTCADTGETGVANLLRI